MRALKRFTFWLDRRWKKKGISGFRSIRFRILVLVPVLLTALLIDLLEIDRAGDDALVMFGLGAMLTLALAVWVYCRALVGLGATSTRRSAIVAKQSRSEKQEQPNG